jgi:anti-sigma factor RsiW
LGARGPLEAGPAGRQAQACRSAELLGEYLDGTLGQRDRQRLEAHLGTCPACRASARTFQCTVDLLHQVPPVAMPGPTRERLRRLVIAGAR